MKDRHNQTTAITHEDQKIEIAWAHLATCRDGEWLADPIMNAYVALLQVRQSPAVQTTRKLSRFQPAVKWRAQGRRLYASRSTGCQRCSDRFKLASAAARVCFRARYSSAFVMCAAHAGSRLAVALAP